MNTSSITAIILCGGSGARLGHLDKPLQSLAGRSLVEHVLARLSAQISRVVISANRNPEAYARFGHPVVGDDIYSDCGPLAGLAAGMRAAETADLLCVPGDAPYLPADLAERLQQARRRDARTVAVVHDGTGLQPLCALLPRVLLPALRRYLDDGGRAAHSWLEQQQPALADFSHWPQWSWSVNTSAEWTAAEQHFRNHDLP